MTPSSVAPPPPPARFFLFFARTKDSFFCCYFFLLGQFLRKYPFSLTQVARDLPPKETIVKTKQYLSIIGAHIDKVVGGGDRSQRLWEYVAEYSNLALSGERISGIYAKLKEKKVAAAAAGAGAGAGATRPV